MQIGFLVDSSIHFLCRGYLYPYEQEDEQEEEKEQEDILFYLALSVLRL